MRPVPDILIVGAGLFGITAALELRERGHSVLLVDQGPPPHPLASSTDISKVVRMEYGSDLFYMDLVEEAMEGFDRWNEELPRPLYHESGVTMLSREVMEPGGFEYESYQALVDRGHQPERLGPDDLRRRFPAWNPESHVDGFFHARGGWVESGELVRHLFERALAEGVTFSTFDALSVLVESDRCEGIRGRNGASLHGGHTLLACGAWIGHLVPELADAIRCTGHPVFHLRPEDPALFSSPNFAVVTADIGRTGWYGFQVHPTEGVVKIGRHGAGLKLDPRNDPRTVSADDDQAMRAFLSETFPALAHAPIVDTRRCLYADSFDADYWLDHHPGMKGLSVATGGSGHGFKMAPLLGSLIADMIEERDNERLKRFRWRSPERVSAKVEAARFEG